MNTSRKFKLYPFIIGIIISVSGIILQVAIAGIGGAMVFPGVFGNLAESGIKMFIAGMSVGLLCGLFALIWTIIWMIKIRKHDLWSLYLIPVILSLLSMAFPLFVGISIIKNQNLRSRLTARSTRTLPLRVPVVSDLSRFLVPNHRAASAAPVSAIR